MYLHPFLINPFIEEARFVNRECPPNPMMIPTIMARLPPIRDDKDR